MFVHCAVQNIHRNIHGKKERKKCKKLIKNNNNNSFILQTPIEIFNHLII